MKTKNTMQFLVLKKKLEKSSHIKITVDGISMLSQLMPGDIVKIKNSNQYSIGDILVFEYEDEGLKIHRLLKVKNEKYYCKGDNSFRLECINKNQVVGKVVEIQRANNNISLLSTDCLFIETALKVSREFVMTGYNHQKVIESDIYNRYKKFYEEGFFGPVSCQSVFVMGHTFKIAV